MNCRHPIPYWKLVPPEDGRDFAFIVKTPLFFSRLLAGLAGRNMEGETYFMNTRSIS